MVSRFLSRRTVEPLGRRRTANAPTLPNASQQSHSRSLSLIKIYSVLNRYCKRFTTLSVGKHWLKFMQINWSQSEWRINSSQGVRQKFASNQILWTVLDKSSESVANSTIITLKSCQPNIFRGCHSWMKWIRVWIISSPIDMVWDLNPYPLIDIVL